MAAMMLEMLSQEVLSCLDKERQAAADAFRGLSKRYAYNEIGGAPLLGIDGICLICHGSSDGRAIANALHGAMLLKDSHINAHIVEELTEASGTTNCSAS
jgi:glycerol-3-phosphate acyltransferase PlsX